MSIEKFKYYQKEVAVFSLLNVLGWFLAFFVAGNPEISLFGPQYFFALFFWVLLTETAILTIIKYTFPGNF